MRIRRCSTCGHRVLTFGGLMRHYLNNHRTIVDATTERRRNGEDTQTTERAEASSDGR